MVNHRLRYEPYAELSQTTNCQDLPTKYIHTTFHILLQIVKTCQELLRFPTNCQDLLQCFIPWTIQTAKHLEFSEFSLCRVSSPVNNDLDTPV